MPDFHIAIEQKIDFDTWERDVAHGQAPRHAVPTLVRRLGAMFHQASRNPSARTFGDRLRSRLYGTVESWALARQLAARLGPSDVVFCADQVVGVPMSATFGRLPPARRPRLAVSVTNLHRPRGHLTAGLFRIANTVDLFLTPCTTQAEFLRDRLNVSEDRLFLILEHLDDRFFTPGPLTPGQRRPVIASAGVEHRDYRTLAAATHDLDVDVKLAAWSRYNRRLARSLPKRLPANMSRRFYKYPELVQLYRDADLVAVPLRPCDSAAGTTTLIEALACRRPVVVTRTQGISDYLSPPDGLSIVEPSDPAALRAAIVHLLDHPEEAQAQARQGYESVPRRYAFDQAVEGLARRIEAL